MPATADLGDTASLDLTGPPIDIEALSTGDTSDFGPDALKDPSGRPSAVAQFRKFTEGIVRFYRARAILSRGAGSELSGLAWSYLEQLEPAQVPGVARPAFFDLAYFMRVQLLERDFDHAGFRRRVLDVAVIMDGFLDDIFLRKIDS
jgi:hypothetical protein